MDGKKVTLPYIKLGVLSVMRDGYRVILRTNGGEWICLVNTAASYHDHHHDQHHHHQHHHHHGCCWCWIACQSSLGRSVSPAAFSYTRQQRQYCSRSCRHFNWQQWLYKLQGDEEGKVRLNLSTRKRRQRRMRICFHFSKYSSSAASMSSWCEYMVPHSLAKIKCAK